MAYFDWDIGPKRRRWEKPGNGDGMVSNNDTTYWLTQFEDICTYRRITEDEKRMLWEAMAHVYSQQMHEKHGACYEALHPLFERQGAETQTDPSVSR